MSLIYLEHLAKNVTESVKIFLKSVELRRRWIRDGLFPAAGDNIHLISHQTQAIVKRYKAE